MSISLAIQKAGVAEFPLLKALLQDQQLPTEDLQEGVQLFYTQVEGQIISCGGYEQYHNIGLLRSVAIRPDKQGSGLGKKWVALLLQKAREQGMQELYLLTTTAESFFEKMGFKSIDRKDVPKVIQQSQEFSSICPSSAAVMYFKL